jgi:hypothetical protein
MTTGQKVAVFLIILMVITLLFWISVILWIKFGWGVSHIPNPLP